MMGSVDNKRLAWLTVENKSCSIRISHKINAMLSIINLLSIYTSIDDVDSHTAYFDVYILWYCSMPEEVSNTTTQSILSSAGEKIAY